MPDSDTLMLNSTLLPIDIIGTPWGAGTVGVSDSQHVYTAKEALGQQVSETRSIDSGSCYRAKNSFVGIWAQVLEPDEAGGSQSLGTSPSLKV